MKRLRTGILMLAAAMLLTACSGSASSSTAASASSEAVSSETTAASSVAVASESVHSGSESSAEDVHVIDGVTFIIREVPNDATGNWRFASISESFDMSEHALEYYSECFGSDSEIHYIINEADNTTTQISYVFGNLDIIIRDHVDEEELDAKTLGSGSIQAEYFVDVSTGEVEKA